MTNQKILGKHTNGKDIIQYTISNSIGVEVKILNYGAIIQAINLPLKTGVKNIVLGFGDYRDYLTDDYINNCPYFGASIGRIAGRVKNGELYCDGKVHQLSRNEGKHHLHGGIEGFDKKIWELEDSGENYIILKYFSPDGEEGYPHDANISVKYSLISDNNFAIEYKADSEKKIPANLTNHTYFNIGNEKTILNHILSTGFTRYLETDSNLNYTGKILKCKNVKKDILQESIKDIITEDGLDKTLYSENDRNFCALKNPENELTIILTTSSPCMQVYAGKYINTKHHKSYSGIALEPMGIPYLPSRFSNAKYDKNLPHINYSVISFFQDNEKEENIFEGHDIHMDNLKRKIKDYKKKNQTEYII